MGLDISSQETHNQPEDSEPVDEDDEDGEDDSNLNVPFDIPIEGVNHTLEFLLRVSWDEFQWQVAQKLHVHPTDVELSYKLPSQLKGDLPRALTDEQDFSNLMQRSRPFVDGTKVCGRGKDFCVQLFPKIVVNKNPASADNIKLTLTQTQKVCRSF